MKVNPKLRARTCQKMFVKTIFVRTMFVNLFCQHVLSMSTCFVNILCQCQHALSMSTCFVNVNIFCLHVLSACFVNMLCQFQHVLSTCFNFPSLWTEFSQTLKSDNNKAMFRTAWAELAVKKKSISYWILRSNPKKYS